MKKRALQLIITILSFLPGMTQELFTETGRAGSFPVAATNAATIFTDEKDFPLVQQAAVYFQQDIERITGKKPGILHDRPREKNIILIGSLEQSSFIRQLTSSNILSVEKIKGKWEAYQVQVVENPMDGVDRALVITGSDRRGTAYGVLEMSRQMGVSPWYWWADVPVKKKKSLYYSAKTLVSDAPKVKYRGIFLNDEAPALTGWAREKFGGLNHLFYEKVFELILRLKGNYLWPAMWGNAFNDDDTLNPVLADKYGIVMGTSHHEPMLRAQQEWKRYGKGKWDYDSNEVVLKGFWKQGIKNMGSHESILTIGMRGDGDMPMSRETATHLLERIVKDQREIIEEVTRKPARETPQLWALYKEVQDYYDKGMRVPDDVTLLLCDDNWGNIRRLPKRSDPPRKGGYGIYYHFDYVGGPRNYKWLNTNPLPRIWEQMHLAYEYGVRDIWIVNVGDLKPMEFPISFWCDYAWNPDKIGSSDLQAYTEKWAAEQFGTPYAKEIATVISGYAKYNGRRKPELLDANTYSLSDYNEFSSVVNEYNALLEKAEKINRLLPEDYRDAYFQLVLHPVKACANLNEMYYYAALNNEAYTHKWAESNEYAGKVKELFHNDSLITLEYHSLNNGKWNHLMDQKHIGYRSWQEPRFQTMPRVRYLPADSVQPSVDSAMSFKEADYPHNTKTNAFYELNKYISIEGDHFTNAVNSSKMQWKVLPDHGRTGSALTVFPVTADEQPPGVSSPHVEYEFYTYSTGKFVIQSYFSPTYNIHDAQEGLQYAISVDEESPQIISINKDSRATEGGIMYNWVANNIIIKKSEHAITRPGKHVLKFWAVHPGVVLQKLVLDFGGVKPSYLGPPETIIKAKN